MAYTTEQINSIMKIIDDSFAPSNTTAAYCSDSYIPVQNISYAESKLRSALTAGTVTDAKSIVQYLYDSLNNFDAENKETPHTGGKIGIQPRLSRTLSRNTDNVVERFMLQAGCDPNTLYVEMQDKLYTEIAKFDEANAKADVGGDDLDDSNPDNA